MDTVDWANPPTGEVPRAFTPIPGPRSSELHARMVRHTAGGVSHAVRLLPVAFDRGHGVTLVDVDGNTYLDFAAGGAVVNLGHAHPAVAEAVAAAAASLEASHDFATPFKVAAQEKLASVTPSGMTLFTFFSSGAEALDAARRVARAATGQPEVVVTPWNGGSVPCDPEQVQRVAATARDDGAVLVADEITTGFGRTGSWFAVDTAAIVPDVLVMGKGLGNGFPVTAIAVKEAHVEALAESVPVTSHGGNPLACAAVGAVIDTMQQEALVEHCAAVGEWALGQIDALAERHPAIGGAWGRGALLGLDVAPDLLVAEPGIDVAGSVFRHALATGLLVGLDGHRLLLTPPIVVTTESFETALALLDDAIGAVEREAGW